MKTINIMAILSLLMTSACGGGGGNSNAGQSFNNFTNSAFTISTDSNPAEVGSVIFNFDVNDNKSIFDTIVTNGEYSV